MKKVWVLQRKFTDLDKEILEELKSEHPEVKVEEKDYYDVVKLANYYKFCSSVKKEFKRADDFAIKELKDTLNKENDGKVVYAEDTKERFKDTHNKVRDSYKVLQCEVEDGVTDYTTYKVVKECDNIKFFLWNDKK